MVEDSHSAESELIFLSFILSELIFLSFSKFSRGPPEVPL